MRLSRFLAFGVALLGSFSASAENSPIPEGRSTDRRPGIIALPKVPLCVSEYMQLLPRIGFASDCVEHIRAMIRAAEKNVRTIKCSNDLTKAGSATFITSRVFITAGHVFRDGNDRERTYARPLSATELSRCYVLRYDSSSQREVADFIDMRWPPYIPDANSVDDWGRDYAIGVVEDALEDAIHLKLMEAGGFSEDMWALVPSQGFERYENCFSVISCTKRTLESASSAEAGAVYTSGCSTAKGASGSGVFILQRSSSSGACFGFGLAGISVGGADVKQSWTDGIGENELAPTSIFVAISGGFRTRLDQFISSIDRDGPKHVRQIPSAEVQNQTIRGFVAHANRIASQVTGLRPQ